MHRSDPEELKRSCASARFARTVPEPRDPGATGGGHATRCHDHDHRVNARPEDPGASMPPMAQTPRARLERRSTRRVTHAPRMTATASSVQAATAPEPCHAGSSNTTRPDPTADRKSATHQPRSQHLEQDDWLRAGRKTAQMTELRQTATRVRARPVNAHGRESMASTPGRARRSTEGRSRRNPLAHHRPPA